MKKYTVSAVLTILLLLLVSCDYLVLSKRGRENPNDEKCPVHNFKALPVNDNFLSISWDARSDSDWDDEGAVAQYLILVGQDSVPRLDSYYSSTRLESIPTFPYEIDLITGFGGAEFNPESLYHIAAFWTWDEETELTDNTWYGPVKDRVLFKTATVSLPVTVDGHIDISNNINFSSTALYVNYFYNEIALIKFNINDLKTAPVKSFRSIGLRLRKAGTSTGTITVGGIGQNWDLPLTHPEANSLTENYKKDLILPEDNNTVICDVLDIVTAWNDGSLGNNGIKLNSAGAGSAIFHASEQTTDNNRPRIDVEYYIDPDRL